MNSASNDTAQGRVKKKTFLKQNPAVFWGLMHFGIFGVNCGFLDGNCYMLSEKY